MRQIILEMKDDLKVFAVNQLYIEKKKDVLNFLNVTGYLCISLTYEFN